MVSRWMILWYMMLTAKILLCIGCWYMKAPEYPVALGVIRDVEGTTYNDALDAQIENVEGEVFYPLC